MSDILSMMVLRDRIKQILMEPTLDKGFTAFASIMLVAFTITLLSPLVTGVIQYDLLIMEAVSCVAATGIGLLYKRFDQEARDKNSVRMKNDINHDYLIKNPKLKETEIYLDRLEEYNDRLNVLSQIVETALKIKINDNGDKYNDPPTASEVTPWNTKETTGTDLSSGTAYTQKTSED